MSAQGAVPEPGPGYTADDGSEGPRSVTKVVAVGVFEVAGVPCVVIETAGRAGVVLDANDTEAIARLAVHVATMRRNS